LIEKQRLEVIKTGIAVLQKSHEEVVNEMESKILAMELLAMNATNKKAQQKEKVEQLEENANQKEELARRAGSNELTGQSAVVIEELREKVRNLEEKVGRLEKKLGGSRRPTVHQKERAMATQLQHRRIAMKLLASVMELDDDVTLPGKQRPISARLPSAEAPSTTSKTNPTLTGLPPTPEPTPQNSMLPFVGGSEREDIEMFPSPTSAAAAPESYSNQSAHSTQQIGDIQATVFVREVNLYSVSRMGMLTDLQHWRRPPQKQN
jgi:actin-related protein